MLRFARKTFAAAAAVVAAALVLGATGAGAARTLDPGTRFYAPGFEPAAHQQWVQLISHGARGDADLIRKLESVPRGVWVTGGTASATRHDVQLTTVLAAAKDEVPVLVAYNIPGRDCGGLSAGGAQTTADYEAWIDAFAEGLGDRRAVVILEPDGLGLLPSGCGGPSAAYPFTDAERYAELNYAVDRLEQQPQAIVYLDGTHSRWLGVGDAARRLVTAGVQSAQGFYVNVSNYQPTDRLAKYSTWISECIAFANNPEEGGWRLGHYDWCASQYYPANVDDFSTWHLSDEWYAANLGHAVPTTHFVVDTSRNGRGPWQPSASYPDAQDWCNPPGRGLGVRPTADTGVPLADAYLWVKVPGESDGSCTRGLGPAGTTVDPEWGFVDPAAGDWFPEQALQLAQLASPPLP